MNMREIRSELWTTQPPHQGRLYIYSVKKNKAILYSVCVTYEIICTDACPRFNHESSRSDLSSLRIRQSAVTGYSNTSIRNKHKRRESLYVNSNIEISALIDDDVPFVSPPLCCSVLCFEHLSAILIPLRVLRYFVFFLWSIFFLFLDLFLFRGL